MRTIIAGSRGIKDYFVVCEAIKRSRFLVISEVVSGCAPGVDRLGERWARENCVPLKEMPAPWAQHKRAAGKIRNRAMAKYACETPPGQLIAVWDGISTGTDDMITIAKHRGMRVFVYNLMLDE